MQEDREDMRKKLNGRLFVDPLLPVLTPGHFLRTSGISRKEAFQNILSDITLATAKISSAANSNVWEMHGLAARLKLPSKSLNS